MIFAGSGYLLLAVSSALAVAWPMTPLHQDAPITMGLVAVTALWMLQTVRGWPSRPLVYYVGLVVLIVALVWANSWFTLFAAIGYGHAFGLLPPRLVAIGVAVQAMLLTAIQTADLASGWLIIVNVAVPMLYAGVMIGHESEKRRRANAALEAALQENIGLHAQLLTQAREAGALDERQRLAREIHDTLAQGLAGIITQLQAEEQTGDRQHLDTAARLARESLSEARRSVQALRPEPLEGTRLAEAVIALAEGWSRDSGVPAKVETTGEPRQVPAEVEVVLFRVAQEALANAAKHAQASRVGVTLSYLDDQVVLDVRDDGTGLVADRAGGFGLTAMRQRVHGVGGKLEIESEPGVGTAISASVPGVDHAD